ncbi:hypothetical protein [Collimonas arenae]|uniref:hypothetical protein n=1 Tax=Collimonas arenae TaxID=279058 RepID=UPI00056EB6D9|nr:hypothetical protein [Collimonas arenae]
MVAIKKKPNPRSPNMPLDDALARALKVYQAEGRHSAPNEVVMKHLGYNGKNGAALQAVASIRYWGLVERPRDGQLMVSKTFEDFQFTPDPAHKQELLIGFLKSPPLYAELLEKYADRLPSDGNLKFDLIQRGFDPAAADTVVGIFKRSVEFVRYYDVVGQPKGQVESVVEKTTEDIVTEGGDIRPQVAPVGQELPRYQFSGVSGSHLDEGMDRVPVKLAGGRRAFLEIPTPFYLADKERLKAYIDFHLADDEDVPQTDGK